MLLAEGRHGDLHDAEGDAHREGREHHGANGGRAERARARLRPGGGLDGAHRRRERKPEGADRRQDCGGHDGGPRRRDHGDGSGEQRAEDEEHLLQPGLERVGGVAQALGREQAGPDRAHARTERGQRRPGQAGARDQRGDRGALRREQRECRERRRIDDAERHQHAHLPHPVHEPPPERHAARAGQRPHGDDDAGDGIRMPFTAQQQHRRERPHPDREAAEQGSAHDPRHPGRDEDVRVPAQARRLLAHLHGAMLGAPKWHTRRVPFPPSEAAPYGRAQRRAPGPRRQNPREFVPSRKAVPLAASGEA